MIKLRTLFLYSFAILISIFSVSGVARAATLAVDSSNCDPSGVPAYCTINLALAASSAYDTITIAAGTYNESLLLNKSISLIGTGAGSVIIDGTGLAGATLPVFAGSLRALVAINPTNSSGSPYLFHIQDITITNSQKFGIGVNGNGKGTVQFELVNTTLNNHTNDLLFMNDVDATSGAPSLIQGNTFTGPSGAYLDGSDYISISGNNFTDSGTGSDQGLGIQQGTHITISNNTFDGWDNYGLLFNATTSQPLDQNSISNNTFQNIGPGALVGGFQLGYGILLTQIANGAGYGSLQISNNTFTNNDQGSVALGAGAFTAGVVSGVAISNNIMSGSGYGVNNLYAATVSATQNWWGDLTGPALSSNPSGAGMSVGGNVTVSPWFTTSTLVLGTLNTSNPPTVGTAYTSGNSSTESIISLITGLGTGATSIISCDYSLNSGGAWSTGSVVTIAGAQYCQATNVDLSSTSLNTIVMEIRNDLGRIAQTTIPAVLDDVTAPVLQDFSSTTSDGVYGPGDTVSIVATYSESIVFGSSVDVITDTGVTVTLSTVLNNTLSGTYTIGSTGSGENSSDLNIASITSQSVADSAGNNNTTTTLPTSNIITTSDIIVDTTSPIVTLVAPFTSTSTNASISATTDENATCEYIFDSGALTPVTTTGTVSHLENFSGVSVMTHTIAFTCTDSAGNLGNSNTTWQVTTPAPTTTVVRSTGGFIRPTPCVTVEYEEWPICEPNHWQFRAIIKQSPPGCSVTAEQQKARERFCSIAPITLPVQGVITTESSSTTISDGQVLGAKIFKDGTLVRTPDKKIYVIIDQKKKYISTLKELAQYNKVKIIETSIESLKDYSDFSGQVKGVKISNSAKKISYQVAIKRFLTTGSKGDDVKLLQRALKDLGFFPQDIDVTGKYGKVTIDAVADFQRSYGIKVTGYVGPTTRAKLVEVSKS